MTRDQAIEAAAKHIYEVKGHRKDVAYVGWEREPDEIKDEWRLDARTTIDAYEAALTQ